MGYQCGLGGNLRGIGIAPRPPGYRCDGEGCRVFQTALRPRGGPYAWALNGKLPPKWRRVGERTLCPACVFSDRQESEHE